MAWFPCYKKTMEDEYHLLRGILLDMNIHEVYKKVLMDQSVGMKQALAILCILNPPLQKMAVQLMGRKSSDRRWKINTTTGTEKHQGTSHKYRDETDWYERGWDSETLAALCLLPVRRLIADCMRSETFKEQLCMRFKSEQPLSTANDVDLIRTLLSTTPVAVLCSEMCFLHERLTKPPFLDCSSTVAMLHYMAAMLASRYIFFRAGMPEMRPQSDDGYTCEVEPCYSCMEAIINSMHAKGLFHAGLSHAIRNHDCFTISRGGWSRYDLLKAYATIDTQVKSLMNQELAQCSNGPSSYCTKMTMENELTDENSDLQRTRADVFVLEKMRELLKVQEFDIAEIASTYNITDTDTCMPDVMCILEHVDRHGKLMDLVQDIYVQNHELGLSLAMIY